MLARLRSFARSWLRSDRIDDELGEELEFHLERQVQANLEAGMSPAEARRAAALSLGGVEEIKEEAREARPGALVRNLGRDLAYGARLLRRSRAFAAASVAIVALGIGAVTAIFSVVYGVVLRPLPYADPERLVALWTRAPRLQLARAFVNAADYRDWRSQNHVFEPRVPALGPAHDQSRRARAQDTGLQLPRRRSLEARGRGARGAERDGHDRPAPRGRLPGH
jgi:putative ABC transport system permease protein